jgi:hypothetical protein
MCITAGQLKSFGFMDTCGIFNLHGIPGIIALICGVISISSYDSELKNLPFALNSFEVRRNAATLAYFLNPSFFLTFFLAVPAPKSY